MRKTAVCALALLLAGGAAGITGGALTASAEEAITLDAENAALFLPESYEQYLPLENPTDVAFSERYVAVADGEKLYVYDGSPYTMFTAEDEISKIQITEDERLFYSSASRLYEYDFAAHTATLVDNVPCASFLVEGDYLYAASVDNNVVYLDRYPLDKLQEENKEGRRISQTYSNIASKLTAANGNIYCIRSNYLVVGFNTVTLDPVGSPSYLDKNSADTIADLKFVCAYGGSLYYTVNGANVSYQSGLYRSDFAGNSECLIEGDGFSALAAYNGKLFCVQGKSVRELHVTEEGVSFTGYEIGAASPSYNRLSGAADAVRAGDLLVIADSKNNRISIYNSLTKEYSTVPCVYNGTPFSPSLVATDGELVAVASGARIYTFRYGEQELTLEKEMLSDVRGLTCIYGNVYYASNAAYGKIGGEQEVSHDYGIPSRMTNDLYGNIYISYGGGTTNAVYCFNEADFLEKNSGVRLSLTLPANTTSLRSDFEGNLYYLLDGGVYQWKADSGAENATLFASVTGNGFVYHGDAAPDYPNTFALGFEDDEVYFGFENYLVRSNANTLRGIPTLDEISVGGALTQAFSAHGTNDLLVNIKAGKIGIRTDLSALRAENPPYFPYEKYYRTQADKQGVLLGKTGEGENDYSLVAVYEDDRSYSVNIFRNASVTPAEGHFKEAKGEFYLSNDVSAYYAPGMHPALADKRLPRGSRVTVLGYVQAADCEYAVVSPASAGRDATGYYVPSSYLTAVNPLGGGADDYLLGAVKGSEEGIVFTAADGTELTVTERTEVKLYKNGDGTYTAVFERDGKRFTAQVNESTVDWGNSEAIRISLIVILSVLALVIIGAYVFLLPREKRKIGP